MFPCGSIACVFSGDIKQINYKLKKCALWRVYECFYRL